MASPPPHSRSWEVNEVADITVVNFVDRRLLDEQNIPLIADDLFRLVDDRGHSNILLDLSRVDFTSSAALGMMLSLHRKLQSIRSRLVFLGVAPDLADEFKSTGLDKIIRLANTLAEAHIIFSQGPGGLLDSAPTRITVEEPPLTGALTADEIRHIDEQGMSLSDTIRIIEASST